MTENWKVMNLEMEVVKTYHKTGMQLLKIIQL